MKTHIAMVIQSSCHLYSKIHYTAFLGDANTVEDLKIPIKQDSTDILIPLDLPRICWWFRTYGTQRKCYRGSLLEF